MKPKTVKLQNTQARMIILPDGTPLGPRESAEVDMDSMEKSKAMMMMVEARYLVPVE